jgi:SWI/SNF-related matrix-associated actin-dependent regulator of chromatin subfamily A containing DEAD/H box 1
LIHIGLGKTVQTIAFLAWLSTQRQSSSSSKSYPHLIIVPASTLANWTNEIARFCPSFEVITYHGNQSERYEIQYTLKLNASEGIYPDIILTTYTIFERESGKSDRQFLYHQSFDYLICDEGHCLKNSASARFMNVNHLKSRHRLLLSGTPVQNDVKELLALLSFSMKDLFKASICEILLQSFQMKQQEEASAARSRGGLTIKHLRSMLAPFVSVAI